MTSVPRAMHSDLKSIISETNAQVSLAICPLQVNKHNAQEQWKKTVFTDVKQFGTFNKVFIDGDE